MQNQLDGGTAVVAVVALLALVNGNSWLTGENGDQEGDLHHLSHDDPFH